MKKKNKIFTKILSTSTNEWYKNQPEFVKPEEKLVFAQLHNFYLDQKLWMNLEVNENFHSYTVFLS